MAIITNELVSNRARLLVVQATPNDRSWIELATHRRRVDVIVATGRHAPIVTPSRGDSRHLHLPRGRLALQPWRTQLFIGMARIIVEQQGQREQDTPYAIVAPNPDFERAGSDPWAIGCAAVSLAQHMKDIGVDLWQRPPTQLNDLPAATAIGAIGLAA